MWKQAKIIDMISLRNVYIISPAADLHRLISGTSQALPDQVAEDVVESDSLADQFSNQFPGMDLPSLLSELRIAKPYSAVVPAKENRTIYLEMLTFLLRQGLVKQLHMYICKQNKTTALNGVASHIT
jgi:hypothetical protein